MSTPRSAESPPCGAAQQEYEVVLHSPPDDVSAVHDLLSLVWADSPHVAPLERFRFETALVELTGNVFEHADDGHGVVCNVVVSVTSERLAAIVTDDGGPLEGDLDAREMPHELAECGRGIPLIRALVDDVTYVRHDARNRWSLERTLQAPGSSRPIE